MAKKKKQIIGVEEIRKAAQTLQDYKAGKSNLDARIVENDRWYKLQHWEQIRPEGATMPTSAWLFNSLINKHADAMDSFPEAVVLPREESDRDDAQLLTSVIKCILNKLDYEQIYSDKWWYKLKAGCSVEGVFWNTEMDNGLGNIDIRTIDILNLFWKPGVKDLEESPNVFHLQLVDNDRLIEDYPELEDELKKNPVIETGQYIYDDTVNTDDMSVVVDWYYKKKIDGKWTLQFCKFCNETVLYASENDQTTRAEGWYNHGKYPFVFDVMFPEEGTPAGFGFLDIMKDPQLYIDKMSAAILENAEWNAKPRYFKRGDDGINEKEFLDINKPIIHVEGGIDESALRAVTPSQVPSTAFNVLQYKIDELKETSGNRDVSQGGTGSGVSAASAIAALQEAGSKLTRDMNKASYRAFKLVIERVLELIRQFYDEERCFRITKENGEMGFVNYSNKNIRGIPQGNDFGLDLGARIPEFDFEIAAMKENSFSTISQNQMAQTFFQMGFFNPQMADQAAACIEMMDFEGKEQVLNKISENGKMFEQLQTMQQALAQMASQLDMATGGNMGQQMLMQVAAAANGQDSAIQPMSSELPGRPASNSAGSNDGDPLGRAVARTNNTTVNTARDRARNVGDPNK